MQKRAYEYSDETIAEHYEKVCGESRFKALAEYLDDCDSDTIWCDICDKYNKCIIYWNRVSILTELGGNVEFFYKDFKKLRETKRSK